MYFIGVDVGGMTVKTGLVKKNGKIVDIKVSKTAKTYSVALNNIISDIKLLLKNNKVKGKDFCGIGLGCPGLVDGNSGVIKFLPNIGWKGEKIASDLKKVFGVKVIVSNDANVAALAESKIGVAKGYSSCVMLTIGTGIGSGIILDGKIYDGFKGAGAEFGHTTLRLGGINCTCGRAGCVECYASATALIRQTKEQMKLDKKSKMWKFVEGNIDAVDGKTAFDGEKAGDKSAKEVCDNYVKYLSESILNILNFLRPEVIVLGGGVSAQGKNLTDRVEKYLKKYDYGYKFAPACKVLTAKLGNDAGIIGAAFLCL